MPNTDVGIEPPSKDWHAITKDEAFERLGAGVQGLSAAEATSRLVKYGQNILERVSQNGPLRILWNQINNPLIWVLLGSSAVAIAIGKVVDGLVVLTVVVLNSIIGFVQEYRAGKAIDALRDMVPDFAHALRDGVVALVPVVELVPGDVILLASGDKVPADVRLVKVKSLRIDESALTGESVPVEKGVDPVALDAPLGDRTCVAFKGTLVTYGTATAVVVVTGGQTELGRISALIQEATDIATPLTRALESLGKIITISILVVSIVILAFGVYRATEAGVALGSALRETLIFAIALAVGAIPEGLPAIVTIALAIGVQRMATRRAIIRKLPAVETLGSTAVICTDKTGTLTRNEMTVRILWTPEDDRVQVKGVGYDPAGEILTKGGKGITPTLRRLLENAALCNDSTLAKMEAGWQITGDPTEGALVVAAEKAGISIGQLRETTPRMDAIPFESENQFMATLHRRGDDSKLVLKGAPEAVLRRCASVDVNDVAAQVEDLASQGMRVLAVVEKPWERPEFELGSQDAEQGFQFCGLVGMIDPPRPEAVEAVRACHAAGIQVKMITGDHEATARAIGSQLGFSDHVEALQGRVLPNLDEDQLRKVVEKTNVFARVAPEHKLLIVRALQTSGHVVAMTGDGVNDAPALKQANIGVAMGITGTSVSKEASDMVLTDDNFATIVAAVEEGRRVYDNLVKSLAFVLPTNLGLAFILMFAVIFLPFDPMSKLLLLPIQPTQLLWINLVAAVALALPLAFEAKEPNVMDRPPRNPKEPIMSPLVIRRTVLASILMTIGAVGLFQLAYGGGLQGEHSLSEAQTMAVTTVIFFQVFYLLNCRSLRDSMFRIGVFSNRWIFVGIGITLSLQAAFIYAPPLQAVFNTAPLSPKMLAWSFLAGVVTLPLISLEKWISARPQHRKKSDRSLSHPAP